MKKILFLSFSLFIIHFSLSAQTPVISVNANTFSQATYDDSLKLVVHNQRGTGLNANARVLKQLPIVNIVDRAVSLANYSAAQTYKTIGGYNADTTGNYAKYRAGLLATSTAIGYFQSKDQAAFDRDIDTGRLAKGIRDTSVAIRAALSNNINYVSGLVSTNKDAINRRADSLKTAIGEQWLGSGNTTINGDIGNINTVGFKSGVDLGASNVSYYFSPKNAFKIGLNTESYSGDRSYLAFDGNSFSWQAYHNSSVGNSTTGTKLFTLEKAFMRFGYTPNDPDEIGNTCDVSITSNSSNFNFTGGTVFRNEANSTFPLRKGLTGYIYSDSTNVLSDAFSEFKKGTMLIIRSTGRAYIKTSPINSSATWETIPYTSEVIKKSAIVPTSSSDSRGSIGDMVSDTNYIYTKTSSGWKRSPLSTF